jgi:hypothetical protein
MQIEAEIELKTQEKDLVLPGDVITTEKGFMR